MTEPIRSPSEAADASALSRMATPWTSIIVGVDFTPCSAVALGQAIRLAGLCRGSASVASAARTSVHGVHVIDKEVVIELEAALSADGKTTRGQLVGDAQRAWAEFARGVPGAEGVPINVSIDNRILGILRQAREHSADLIVIGAFGRRQPEVGMGTVATACVRKSMTDVLLVRDTSPERGCAPFRTIVVALDFSDTSLRAVARAAMLAALDDAELHLLHVFQAPWRRLDYNAPTPLATPQLQKQYRDGLQRRIAEFCRPAIESVGAAGSVRANVCLHDDGGHRSGIVEYAGSVGADLIVLGTRGRTNLRDILLGSTAEKVLEESKCSILVVKPEGFHHPLAAGEEPRLWGVGPEH